MFVLVTHAEAKWLKALQNILGNLVEVYSGGTHIANEVNLNAIEVMKEIGIDISNQKPKLVSEIPEPVDILVTMGYGVVCPFIDSLLTEDWGLEDPVGKPIEEFRRIRDIIKEKVEYINMSF